MWLSMLCVFLDNRWSESRLEKENKKVKRNIKGLTKQCSQYPTQPAKDEMGPLLVQSEVVHAGYSAIRQDMSAERGLINRGIPGIGEYLHV